MPRCILCILSLSYGQYSQQIALVSANNKEWKAWDREIPKTVEVVATIAQCITANRSLKDAKDAEKNVSLLLFDHTYKTSYVGLLYSDLKSHSINNLRRSGQKLSLATTINTTQL